MTSLQQVIDVFWATARKRGGFPQGIDHSGNNLTAFARDELETIHKELGNIEQLIRARTLAYPILTDFSKLDVHDLKTLGSGFCLLVADEEPELIKAMLRLAPFVHVCKIEPADFWFIVNGEQVHLRERKRQDDAGSRQRFAGQKRRMLDLVQTGEVPLSNMDVLFEYFVDVSRHKMEGGVPIPTLDTKEMNLLEMHGLHTTITIGPLHTIRKMLTHCRTILEHGSFLAESRRKEREAAALEAEQAFAGNQEAAGVLPLTEERPPIQRLGKVVAGESKNYATVRALFVGMLKRTPGISGECAHAIAERYGNLQNLADVYRALPTVQEQALLLSETIEFTPRRSLGKSRKMEADGKTVPRRMTPLLSALVHRAICGHPDVALALSDEEKKSIQKAVQSKKKKQNQQKTTKK